MTYKPQPGKPAYATDGSSLLPGAQQGPAAFFEPRWDRDFVTIPAR